MIPALEMYKQQVMVEPVKVAGKKLVPFTIGHALAMQVMGLQKIEEPEPLLTSILLCSMPVETFNRKLQSKWFHLKVFIWSWRWGLRWLNPMSFGRGLVAFGKYLEDETAVPDYEPIARGEEVDSEVPFVQHLRMVLISKLGYRPETVMATRFTVAHWDYFALMEAEKAIRVLNGRKGENHAARFADADARHEERIRKAKEMALAREREDGTH